MHWFVDTNQLQPEQYQAPETYHVPRSKQNHIPTRYAGSPEGPRRRRAPGLRVPQERRTALMRHNFDTQDDLSDCDRRRFEPTRCWAHDSDQLPERDQDNQYHRHWEAYPAQYQFEPSRAMRRDYAEVPDDRPRWSDDGNICARRRMNASNRHEYQWTNEQAQHSRLPSHFDKLCPNRRPTPTQRRLAIPNVLVRPDIEGSFPRTRRWRADPSQERDSPQIPVNYILPPQGFSHHHTADYTLPQQPAEYGMHPKQPVDYEPVLPQHQMDYGAVLPQPQHQMNYGPVLTQPPVDFTSLLPQQPVHYGTVLPQPLEYSSLLSQQPVDYGGVLPQQTMDYRGVLPQQPVDYRTALPQQPDYTAVYSQQPAAYGQMSQQIYGWNSAYGIPQVDYGSMVAPQTVNYAMPDYGAATALQGADRKGTTSAPPNLMWNSKMPHLQSKPGT